MALRDITRTRMLVKSRRKLSKLKLSCVCPFRSPCNVVSYACPWLYAFALRSILNFIALVFANAYYYKGRAPLGGFSHIVLITWKGCLAR